MSKKRIGLLYSVGSPWARNLALALADAGCEIHFFSFDSIGTGIGYLKDVPEAHREAEQDFAARGVHLHKLPLLGPGLIKYVLVAPILYRRAKALQLDALLAIYAGGFGLMALLSGIRPFAIYTVGDDILVLRGLRARLINQVLKFSSKIFAHGGHLARQTQLRTKNPVENLVFGIDTEIFKPDLTKRPAIMKLLCTRGFDDIYNNQYIVQALECLPPELDYEMVFTSSGANLGAVKRYVATLPEAVRRRIYFLGGVSRDRLIHELQTATILLSVSLSDGAAISVQEGMACGLFLVLSDIPSNREWLNPEATNGQIVPLQAPLAFAQLLAKVMRYSPERMLQAGIDNRELILKNCSMKTNTLRIQSELLKLEKIR